MPQIPVSKLNYLEGVAQTYAEMVAKTTKPLAAFYLAFDDEPDNWDTIKNLENSVKEIADSYNIKYFVRNFQQEYRDSPLSKIDFTPATEFILFKQDTILKKYLSIINKKSRSDDDHIRLGKIFGYTDAVINEFINKK